jgi:glycosyltransferase involved in cell wall biosynthesis
MEIAVVVDELRPRELSHARAQARRLRRAGLGVVGLRRRLSRDELTSVSVVHGVGRGAWRSARRLARRHGAPIVYDHPPGTEPPRRLGRVDVIVAPGPVEASLIAPNAGKTDRLIVVPPEGAASPGRIRPRLRRRLKIEARTVALQEAEAVSLPQGEALIRAVSALANVDLVFLGGDPWRHRPVLAEVAEELGTLARVHFVGDVSRTRRVAYLAEADVGLALAEGRCQPGCLPAADVFATLGIPFVVAATGAPGPGLPNCIASGEDPVSLAEAIAMADSRGRLPAHDGGAEDLASLVASVAAPDAQGEPLETPTLPRPTRFSRRATEAAPDDYRSATSLLGEARTYQRSGDVEQAVKLYDEIVSGPFRSDAVATAAAGLARLNERAAAQAAIQRVMGDPSRSPLAVARAAETAAVLGDLRRAREHLDEVLADSDAPKPALRTAVRVLEQSGEPRAALRLARQSDDESSISRIEGVLKSYDPTWLPMAGGHGPAPLPSGSRSLVLLETSLPYIRSGYTYRAQTLLRAQRRAGVEPVALTRLGFPATRGLSAPTTERIDGVVHHRADLPDARNYTSVPVSEQLEANARWASAIGSELRPEAIVATTPHLNGLLGLALRKALQVPLVYDVRGFPEMTWAVRDGGADTDVFGLRRIAETRCMREADLVTTLSETMREHIISRGVPSERVLLLPHAVDTEAFAPAEPDEALAASLGLAGRSVVGYISSLVPYEGVGTLLDAIALARGTHPEIAGLVVGDGESLPSLEAQAQRLGLEGHVVFTGRVEAAEIARYYSLMDVFACPREDHEVTRYVTPLKPFEAMAAGCCLAVSDLPTLREAVRDGECGALFPAGDAGALAATIRGLMDRPEERRKLGRAAREHAVERHGIDTLRTRFEQVWDELRVVA